MLKQRILTAAVLLPLMLLMLFCAGSFLWAAFSALIALLVLWEYGRLASLSERQQIPYLGGTAFFMLTAWAGGWELPPFVHVIVLLFWLVVMPRWLYRKWRVSASASGMFVGWLLVLPFWFALVSLRPDAEAAGRLLAVMVLVWLADCGAYFVGRKFGKTKLAPNLSPKKSWEGAIGGLVLVLVYTSFARSAGWLGFEASWPAAMLAAAVLTFVSIGGDLLESWLKRAAGVKDSSNLLPGHGGVFDRMDSMMAVLPVYAAILVLVS